jgi:hypothetical protein
MRVRVARIIGTLLVLGMVALTSGVTFFSRVSANDSLPQVDLNADNLGPRAIEDLTARVIARDYANAWQTMAQALEQNRPELLDGYFAGLAKENLFHRVADQKTTNLRVRYQDRGHKLEALFYSPAGDAMQLRDHARLDIDVMDGEKVIQSEQVNLQYMVLMTPGADRWLVRDLEIVPEVKP